MQVILHPVSKMNLFDVPELMLHILPYLNWESLIAFGHTNQTGRNYMKNCMRDIVISILITYFMTHCTYLNITVAVSILTSIDSYVHRISSPTRGYWRRYYRLLDASIAFVRSRS